MVKKRAVVWLLSWSQPKKCNKFFSKFALRTDQMSKDNWMTRNEWARLLSLPGHLWRRRSVAKFMQAYLYTDFICILFSNAASLFSGNIGNCVGVCAEPIRICNSLTSTRNCSSKKLPSQPSKKERERVHNPLRRIIFLTYFFQHWPIRCWGWISFALKEKFCSTIVREFSRAKVSLLKSHKKNLTVSKAMLAS